MPPNDRQRSLRRRTARQGSGGGGGGGGNGGGAGGGGGGGGAGGGGGGGGSGGNAGISDCGWILIICFIIVVGCVIIMVVAVFLNIDTSSDVHSAQSFSVDSITLIINHADGRQLILTLPLATTLKDLYKQVADRLSSSSIYPHLSSSSIYHRLFSPPIYLYLVYNNQIFRLDDEDQFMTLKQIKFSSETIQLLGSYSLIKQLKIFIQTSNSSSNRRSSLSSKREYTMMDSDRFEIIFDAYKCDMKSTNIRFEFDGDTLHPHATPMDYDMVDGQILDAFILPTSKQSNTKKTKEILFGEEESDN